MNYDDFLDDDLFVDPEELRAMSGNSGKPWADDCGASEEEF